MPPTHTMIPIDSLDARSFAGVQGVLTDIDDTVSTEGKLTAGAYAALWELREAGLKVLAITGRPAGWCDHIARFWPVDAVVGENGGFYFHHDGERLHRRYMHDEAQRAAFRGRLGAVRERILREVAGTALASDQLYREYDLAIDFCEDVPPLPREQIVRIKEIFEEEGAHAKISSIHVNGWFGEFDKLSTTRLCAGELLGIGEAALRERYVFCGDSPNDEPMFHWFEHSIAMANILDFVDLLEHPPRYITRRRAGAGFIEAAALLLAARKGDHTS